MLPVGIKVFGLLPLGCIAEYISLGYATETATLTLGKCSPAASNFIGIHGFAKSNND
jgi:hypothetical protein